MDKNNGIYDPAPFKEKLAGMTRRERLAICAASGRDERTVRRIAAGDEGVKIDTIREVMKALHLPYKKVFNAKVHEAYLRELK